MEKGMAGDRSQTAQAAAPMTSVAPPDTGEKSIADIMEPPKKKRGGGKPAGSITHPREGEFAQATLSKDADGTTRVTNDETGHSWVWDGDGEMWRGEGDAPDWSAEEVGDPGSFAAGLSGHPNQPRAT